MKKNTLLNGGRFIVVICAVCAMLIAAWQDASEGNYLLLVLISSLIASVLFFLWITNNSPKRQEVHIEKKDIYCKERLDAVKRYSNLFAWKTRDTLHYMAQDMVDKEKWAISEKNRQILSIAGSMIGYAMARDLDRLSGNPFAHTDNAIRYDLNRYGIEELDELPAIYLVDFYYTLLASNDKEGSIDKIKQAYQRDIESPKQNYLPPFKKIAIEQYTDRPLYGLAEKDPLPEGAEWVAIDG